MFNINYSQIYTVIVKSEFQGWASSCFKHSITYLMKCLMNPNLMTVNKFTSQLIRFPPFICQTEL